MKLSYTVLYFLMIAALTVCMVLARRSPRQGRSAVAWLEASLIVPIIGNIIIIQTESLSLSIIGHYIYFLGVDIAMLALVNFTNAYCTGIGDGTQKPTVMYVALGVDALQLLLNPFFGHAFSVERSMVADGVYFRLVPHIGLTIHRVVDFGVLLCVILIFTLASVVTPKIYRERFTVLLGSMIAVGLMQAYFILSKSPYDRSVIGYAFFGFVIFYFAICYRPLRLLDQLLSNIVSDLSDAFYIFDPTGKCIWANEQGCRLVGFTGKIYEEINAGLTAIFGEPLVSDDAPDRRAVGEGEDVRFYSLEEKQVQGSSGRYNGSYLRIRDVTNDEREIQVRDQQIGQISREAYRDALTGVGSKSAYNNKVIELNEQLADGLTEFAVVMVDLNDLKQINDQFGHKAGDLYIRGCCHLVCEAFKHSPVFRIGGDEFVAILRGSDFEARHENVQSLRTAYSQAFEKPDVEPWQRYSASVGMAEHASDDNSFELVFKRADQAMYEEKKQFKEKHGSYR